MPAFVVVTGGVVSSIGKGSTTASLAALMQARGFRTSVVKIDPYLNVDAGLMSPIEHGEVYVTYDGVETDLDIGNYERFLGVKISGNNNLTTGKVYSQVLALERNGHYLGKTVQILPHLTNFIKDTIIGIAKEIDILLIEVGGVVGDIESQPFIETLRQLHLDRNNRCVYVHLGLIPFLESVNENKTKPMQHSVKMLLSMGIQPDFLVCRSQRPLRPSELEKIAMFCNVDSGRVIASPDILSKYQLPAKLSEAKLDQLILDHLGMAAPGGEGKIALWSQLSEQIANAKTLPTIQLGFVRKYLSNVDNYVSLIDSLILTGYRNNVAVKINFLDMNSTDLKAEVLAQDAIVVAGGFGETSIETKIEAITAARENNLPFLGICLGFQLACVEFARSILKLKASNTEEVDPNVEHPIIMELGKLFAIEEGENGKTFRQIKRIGSRTIDIQPNSLFHTVYNSDTCEERYRHRFTLNSKYRAQFEAAGLKFSMTNTEGEHQTVEGFELPSADFFVGVQFHPEYLSTVFNPHPIFDHLVKKGIKRAEARHEPPKA